MATKFHTRYSDKAHAEPFVFKKDSKTQSEYGYCLDINEIVNGVHNPFMQDPKEVVYGMQNITPDSFAKSMYEVADAESKFAELPSRIRTRFDNSPQKLLEFISNEKNYDEGVKLGLFNPKAPSPETVAETVTPAPSGDVGA